MPEIPNVVSGEPVESAWGNDIRDRTVQRYADSTERDALVPLPVAGDLAWLDSERFLTYYDGTAWVDVGRARFISLNRGIGLGDVAVSTQDVWTDWGSSLNLGPGDPGRNFVTAQLSGSILTNGTTAGAWNTWRVRIGISDDSGSTYDYFISEGIWGTTEQLARRGIIGAVSVRDIPVLGTASVRVKAQALLAGGGNTTNFQLGVLTAQMARSDGKS